ncbi:MAG: cell division protein FtsQ/DivIB [Prevotellaceae bacterium]|nr:cell division protein FtsQ/DivIB [Prevotellaceae bacterium]
MRAGSVISTILKYLVLLAIVAYLVFVVIEVIRPAENEVCTGVELCLEGDTTNTLIDRSGIIRILSSHKMVIEGRPFRELDIKRIDSLLQSNPYVDTVVSYPSSSGELCIRMRLAEPLLHIIPESGKEFYLDRQGRILPAGGLNTNLCIVTGNVTRQFIKDHLLSLATIVNDDPYWRLQAQQINVTEKREIQLIPRTGNHTVILGDSAKMVEKLQRVRLFYEKGMPEVGWNTYKTINAEYNGQIVCTRK